IIPNTSPYFFFNDDPTFTRHHKSPEPAANGNDQGFANYTIIPASLDAVPLSNSTYVILDPEDYNSTGNPGMHYVKYQIYYFSNPASEGQTLEQFLRQLEAAKGDKKIIAKDIDDLYKNH